jgi:hypothetical protein
VSSCSLFVVVDITFCDGNFAKCPKCGLVVSELSRAMHCLNFLGQGGNFDISLDNPKNFCQKNPQIISGIRDTSVERPLMLYRSPDTASIRHAGPSKDLATGLDILLHFTLYAG